MEKGFWIECPSCKDKCFVQFGHTEILIRCSCGQVFEVADSVVKEKMESLVAKKSI